MTRLPVYSVRVLSVLLAVLPLCGALLLTTGCELNGPRYRRVAAPPAVRTEAYGIAEQYLGMEYEWGGQDHYSSKGIDCSGLVVNCYREALYSTQYVLPYSDATAADLRSRYSLSVEQPQRGDLVFMGAPDSASVTHIAIMDRIESQRVYFIDASTSGDYDGVEYRSYSLDNPKIKGFARALLFAPR